MANRRFTRTMALLALDGFVVDILDRNPELFAPDWNLNAHVNTPTITCSEARRIVDLLYAAANRPTPTYTDATEEEINQIANELESDNG